MRKLAFGICENKGADQLCGSRTADHRPCFRYIDSKSLFFRNFKPPAIFCGCTARFVSDLVGNPEDRFSHNEAQMSFDLDSQICVTGKLYDVKVCLFVCLG